MSPDVNCCLSCNKSSNSALPSILSCSAHVSFLSLSNRFNEFVCLFVCFRWGLLHSMNKFDVFAHFLTVLKFLLYLIISGEIFLKYKVLEETKPYKFPKTANIDERFENFPKQGFTWTFGNSPNYNGFFF